MPAESQTLSEAMNSLGSIAEGVLKDAKGSGDLPSERGGRAPTGIPGKQGTPESGESQLQRLLNDPDPDDNGEDELTRRGKGGKGPAKSAKLDLPGDEPQAPKPPKRAPKARDDAGDANDGDPGETEQENAEAVAEAVAAHIRKLKRYGRDMEVDTSNPTAAIDQLFGMVGDDAEVSVTIDGQEYLIPQGELALGYQRSAAANKRFADAQALQAQTNQMFNAFRANPAALLRQMNIDPITDEGLVVELLHAIGIQDPIEWAGKYAWTEVERRSMQNPTAANYNPQQFVRTELERERRMDALKREREAAVQQATQQQQQQAYQRQQAEQQLTAFANAMPAALAKVGLPVNDLVQQVSWRLFQQAQQAGAPVTPELLAADAREWIEDNVRGMYGSAPTAQFRKVFGDSPIKAQLAELASGDGEALLDFLGTDLMKAIRKADTKRLSGKNRAPRESVATAMPITANGGPRAGATMSTAEASALIRSGRLI